MVPQVTAERPILTITLRPHRSLSRRGVTLVMVVLCAMLAIPGLAFYTIGAWPVVGFMGLDVALVFAAFRLSFRSARAFQEIRVSRSALTVREAGPTGEARETTFNPYWARLDVVRRDDVIVRMALTSHGARLEIGRFLPLPEREPVARKLTAALAEARSVA